MNHHPIAGPTPDRQGCIDLPVSVIIPAHNAGKWLARAVTSVLAAGYELPEEVLIINDASTDDTLEVANALSSQWSRVRVLTRHIKGGAASARLDGVRAAQSEWIALLDSDDFLGPGAVGLAYVEAQKFQADICIWELHREHLDGRRTIFVDTRELHFPMSGSEAARLTLGGWKVHPLGVMKRELFLAANHDVGVDIFSSDELVTRRLLHGAERLVSCTGTYHYVENPQSTTRSSDTDRSRVFLADVWLVRFALENGYLRGDRALAAQMVNGGLISTNRALANARGVGDGLEIENQVHEAVLVLTAANPWFVFGGPRAVMASLWRHWQLASLRRKVGGRKDAP
jgi:glycosyltransferase involved in cell wall biosynthesis